MGYWYAEGRVWFGKSDTVAESSTQEGLLDALISLDDLPIITHVAYVETCDDSIIYSQSELRDYNRLVQNEWHAVDRVPVRYEMAGAGLNGRM